MAHEIFTAGWAGAWCREINESEAYRETAESWEGAVALVLSADAAYGVPEERVVRVDLWHGECRGAGVPSPAELEETPYVLRGDPDSWEKVLTGELDPVGGLMRGKLKLERGKVFELARYVQAAQELVAAASRVASEFPEGWERG